MVKSKIKYKEQFDTLCELTTKLQLADGVNRLSIYLTKRS
jgi:hypothetical protein